jgi:hypothetical protein
MSDETRAKLAISRAKPRTSVHEFVNEWVGHSTIYEIAAALDVSPASVQTRAKTLRKLGVKLPDRVLGGPGRGGGGGRAGRVGYSALTVQQLNLLISGAQNGTLEVDTNGRPVVDGQDVFTAGSAPDSASEAGDDSDDSIL